MIEYFFFLFSFNSTVCLHVIKLKHEDFCFPIGGQIFLPLILQVGVALLQVLSALHVRVVDAEIVYPVLQLNVATD